MQESLKKRTFRALVWSGVEQFGQQGIRLVLIMVLARLLTPEDFGVLGMLMAFIFVAEAVVNNGFGQAVIQKKNISEDDLTTTFFLSLITALLLYGIFFFTAGAIGSFYNQPGLKNLTRVLALVIVLDAFVIIQRVQFERRLDFRKISTATIISSILSGVVAITFALYGLGVWSLVAMLLMQKFFFAAFLWHKSAWVPRGKINKDSFLSLFHFGWKLQVSGVLAQFFQNIHALIIGRFFAAATVGYYTQAKRIKDLPMKKLSGIVSKVVFPAFSTIQDNLQRLREGFRKSVSMLAFVSFPLMLGMMATAERFIPAILGEQCLPAIPFFQLLCLVGMLYPLHASNMNILKVTGRTDIFLKLEVAKKILALTVIFISIRWGVYGLIVGQVVTSYLALGLNATYAGRLIDYPLTAQIRDVAPYLGISAVMAVAVMGVGTGLPIENPIIMLSVQFVTGTIIYAGLCHLIGMKAWQELLALRNLIRCESTAQP